MSYIGDIDVFTISNLCHLISLKKEKRAQVSKKKNFQFLSRSCFVYVNGSGKRVQCQRCAHDEHSSSFDADHRSSIWPSRPIFISPDCIFWNFFVFSFSSFSAITWRTNIFSAASSSLFWLINLSSEKLHFFAVLLCCWIFSHFLFDGRRYHEEEKIHISAIMQLSVCRCQLELVDPRLGTMRFRS